MRRIQKGDLVQVISGKNKGKTGKISKIFPKESLVVLEGMNLFKKHKKPSKENPKGQIVDVEVPIHMAKVMPIDPKNAKPTRVKHLVVNGEKMRVGKSGEVLKG